MLTAQEIQELIGKLTTAFEEEGIDAEVIIPLDPCIEEKIKGEG